MRASSPSPEREAAREAVGRGCSLKRASGRLRRRPSPARGEGEQRGEKKTAKIHGQLEGPERIVFSEKFACPVSGFTIPEIEPRLFSFNNPFGACPNCGGLGVEQQIDADLVIPDKDRTLRGGAIAPWAKSSSPYYIQTLTALGKHYKFTLDTKWKDLPKKTQDAILYGSGEDAIRFVYDDGMRSYETKKPFEGVITNLERRWKETESDWAREEMAKYFTDIPCAACNGYRLKPEALCVKIGGTHIGEVAEMSVKRAGEWFTELPQRLTPKQNEIAGRVLKEIRERLKFLVDVGLEYLTLARASGTLSGGESQRIRLASQIGSGLTGVLYVLDEPSIGLHQRDNARLLETLKRLRDLGNTVIVVEHDEDAIRTADYVLDIGPGAGIHGGHIVAQGTVEDLIAAPQLADRQISLRRTDGAGARAPRADNRRALKVVNARGNNLKNITAEIPLGLFTCVTGVSGGGKSTLLVDTLYKAIARKLNGASEAPAPHDRIEGLEHLDKVIDIDQSPIGRTPRSQPRDLYRRVHADPRMVRRPARGQGARLRAGPLLVQRQGRALRGLPGRRRHQDRDALPARRLRHLRCLQGQALQPRDARGHVQGQVHRRRARHDGRGRRSTSSRRCRGCATCWSCCTASASTTSTSASRPRRCRAARRSASSSPRNCRKRATGRTLYILDEPTTGLHFHDVAKLLEVLHELVETGNTVVVIEHNLEVIKTADWIIDLGPEGGDGGGEIVAAGHARGRGEGEAQLYRRVPQAGAGARREAGRKGRTEAGESNFDEVNPLLLPVRLTAS